MTISPKHLEILVEEPSMQAFLQEVLSQAIPSCTFTIHAFQGKFDLMKRLPERLRAYSRWVTDLHRIIVMIDRDRDDCHELKRKLEDVASNAGLVSRTWAMDHHWQIVNRVVIEELESWYFGDWEAVRTAYSKVPASIPAQRAYRDPDDIAGGTWEAFERILRQYGYFKTGLRKIEAARAIGVHIDPLRNNSRSFMSFYNAITEAASQ